MTFLSIVVAAVDCADSVEDCLSSIRSQIAGIDCELLVVALEGTSEAVHANMTLPGPVLVPILWRAGILASSGTWVAVTTAQCIPDGRWVGAILASLDDAAVAVGGPILPGASPSHVAAAHLLRYSGYMLPFERHSVEDVPGDNAVYRRAAIDSVAESWQDGFWENVVNRKLHEQGLRMVMDPRPIIQLASVGGPLAFAVQRFRHGREFGRQRGQRFRALGAPLVPVIMLRRIAGRMSLHPVYRSMLPAAFPWLLVFILCWTVGETFGLLQGPE